ncbi:MAG TPA: gluconate 2-dehydrogenase subunit 3 family protein [Bryobacteraceae bacterium]|nr:gluconate 2-dehydrogenase subunit 3 family protein [Bryobacteraceae bacterium]
MKRRELLYSLLGVSGLPAFVQAQQPAIPPATDALPPLRLTNPNEVAEGVPKFFARTEFTSFQRLGNIIMPPAEGEPGALDAKAAEFLDFLLSESPAELQTLYRNGIRELDKRSLQRHKQNFVNLPDGGIVDVLSPLNASWTYQGPTEPFAQFLQASKIAFYQATVNSREWSEAQSSRRRGAAGLNTYYLPVE